MPASTTASLVPPMHHNRRRLSAPASYLLLHVGPVLDVLTEIADVASDFVARLERERYDGHEAEGEPFPALHYLDMCVLAGYGEGQRDGETYAAGEVTAVLALDGYVLCASEGGVED